MTSAHILYLQLPLLDNDTKAARENFPFAGAYLDHALKCSAEAPFYSSSFAPSKWDDFDTHHLADALLTTGASIIVCTLYLWNVERTMRLTSLLKKRKPSLKVIAGGPEAAKDHPLLFGPASKFDAIIIGEGEIVFPALLEAWRINMALTFDSVAQRGPNGWSWGSETPPAVDLSDAQPDETDIMNCVQNRPVIYLETVRGCPLTCSYCRYYQMHTGLRTLTPEQVIQRIRRFREQGATEIRFVDPTFNARRGFSKLLEALVRLNHNQHLSFFAEIRSDTLTERQAKLMRRANFTAVEVGVQSVDPVVLQNITRPVRLDKVTAGIHALCKAGVSVVLDLMYGLPGQTIADIHQSLKWALAFGSGVQVQCMQTLVLPGTQLRNEVTAWGLSHESLPPYNIKQTPHLTPDHIREIEMMLHEHPRLPADPVTPRYCSQRLSGLFREQHRIKTSQLHLPVPGRGNRRALLIHGPDLFVHHKSISNLIDRSINTEPDGLWQFVLVPEREEPLDLLEKLICCIQQHTPHLLDRYASASAFNHIVSRRLYVRTNSSISNEWKLAAEHLLCQFFG